MTTDEKVSMLLSLLDEAVQPESIQRLQTYLEAAKREIISWRGGRNSGEVPAEYEMTQIYAVIAGFSQSGAENQTAHSENGISRSFRFPDMIAYIRANVVPYVGVL